MLLVSASVYGRSNLSLSSFLQPGPRDGTIQCFIKRDKSRLTYHLYLCLNPGKLFLLLVPDAWSNIASILYVFIINKNM